MRPEDIRLDSLLSKPVSEMTDEELRDYKQKIRSLGVKSHAKKVVKRSTSTKAQKMRAQEKRLRAQLAEKGMSSAEIEEAILMYRRVWNANAKS